MLEGQIKNQLDAIRQDFYNANDTQNVAKHLTMLIAMKMLDDRQSLAEASASVVGTVLPDSMATFKVGEYQYFEEGKTEPKFSIPYSKLRWKNFKMLPPHELAVTLREYVVPFIKDPKNHALGDLWKYIKDYSFSFEGSGKERLLALVVDKLSDPIFDFTKSDISGDVYEYICGTAISGQFRTPRHIIDMAVKIIKPKLGEKIIDPAMGTAGFLIAAAKFINEHENDELMVKENRYMFDNSFYGCDTDTGMATTGYINSICHDIGTPHISIDSLLEKENATGLLGTFDVVLQNPPFSGSLEENTVSDELLALADTKKTELLFVALADKLLKLGGRCMSVVPDGVLFGSSNAHISLRKELVDNQKLVGIISMPQGLFSAPAKKGSASKGAGVKTSYIFFKKTDNGGTDNVLFFDLTNDGYSLDAKRQPIEGGECDEAVEVFENIEENKKLYVEMKDEEKEAQRYNKWFFVPKSEIVKANYDLTINKYKKVTKEQVEYRKARAIVSDILTIDEEEQKDLELLLKLLPEEKDNEEGKGTQENNE